MRRLIGKIVDIFTKLPSHSGLLSVMKRNSRGVANYGEPQASVKKKKEEIVFFREKEGVSRGCLESEFIKRLWQLLNGRVVAELKENLSSCWGM